jgi:hypothetical protein
MAFAACSQAGVLPTLTLLPGDGSVSGAPGSVVGWGFSLTFTSTSDWVLLTGSAFTGSPVYGTYVDYLSLSNAPLYIAGPAPESSTVTQSWGPAANPQLGLGEFDIYPTALPGIPIPGNLVVNYDEFSQDPNNPNFDPGSFVTSGTITLPAEVTVTPEPSSVWAVGSGVLLALAWAGRRRIRT